MGGLNIRQQRLKDAALAKIKERQATMKKHRHICHIEREKYKEERDGQDEKYKQAAIDFKTLMNELEQLNTVQQKREAIERFVSKHGTIKLYVDMAFQADKILQKFKNQPGPVY